MKRKRNTQKVNLSLEHNLSFKSNFKYNLMITAFVKVTLNYACCDISIHVLKNCF